MDRAGLDPAATLLVIGVHQEELSFGEGVATALLDPGDLPDVAVLRVPEGISGRHPRPDQRFRYQVQHEALYRQIRRAAGRRHLLIDLHRGTDDGGPCADIICGDGHLLAALGRRRRDDSRVRLVGLGDAAGGRRSGVLAAHTVIPRDVWDSPDFLFVGLEVYIPSGNGGSANDWAFAADLIKDIIAAAQAGTPEHKSPTNDEGTPWPGPARTRSTARP